MVFPDMGYLCGLVTGVGMRVPLQVVSN